MPHPMDDVLVVIPGIMGSTLYRGDRPVWEPSGAAVVPALTSLFRNITSLRLPEGIGDQHPDDGVRAVKLMPDIRLPFGLWTFDLGYSKLLDFLRATFAVVEPTAEDPTSPANLITFPYDWRLSNRYNGERLRDVVGPALQRWQGQGGPYTEAKLVFICHSMGGLVARWYVDRLGGAEVTRKLITLGTPHRGAVNALDQLVNGVRKGPGPFKLNLTAFARSLPSAHQLLPEYACIESGDDLAKTTEVKVPELATDMATDAMGFHTQIDEPRAQAKPGYELHPIVGFEQPTWTTARLRDQQMILVRTIRTKQSDGKTVDIDGRGDATVPRLAAAPPDVDPGSAILKYAADNHGGLVHNSVVFDELEGILTASPLRYRAPVARIAVEVTEVLDLGEPLTVRAELPGGDPLALEVAVAEQHGNELEVMRLSGTAQAQQAEIMLSQPGVYQVTIRGAGRARTKVSPVTTAVLVWPPESAFDPDYLKREY
jgi:pimeloyl-ACP methyl ester carboxylesterase